MFEHTVTEKHDLIKRKQTKTNKRRGEFSMGLKIPTTAKKGRKKKKKHELTIDELKSRGAVINSDMEVLSGT